MQRRELLKTLALAGVASAFGVRSGALEVLQASAAEKVEGFSFIESCPAGWRARKKLNLWPRL
jgi:hypothetical protein